MRPSHFFAFCIIWLASTTAVARTVVIDDSGTLPNNAALTMRWQQASPRGPNANTLTGTVTLRVKLNVAAWQRRNLRIYLALPQQSPGPMSASWTTGGRLLPGRVTSGSRMLVYAGPITGPFIEDNVQLTIAVDGRRMLQQYQLNFRFETDED
jgi:hypothetical protein